MTHSEAFAAVEQLLSQLKIKIKHDEIRYLPDESGALKEHVTHGTRRLEGMEVIPLLHKFAAVPLAQFEDQLERGEITPVRYFERMAMLIQEFKDFRRTERLAPLLGEVNSGVTEVGAATSRSGV